jgi:hypothetical protein
MKLMVARQMENDKPSIAEKKKKPAVVQEQSLIVMSRTILEMSDDEHDNRTVSYTPTVSYENQKGSVQSEHSAMVQKLTSHSLTPTQSQTPASDDGWNDFNSLGIQSVHHDGIAFISLLIVVPDSSPYIYSHKYQKWISGTDGKEVVSSNRSRNRSRQHKQKTTPTPAYVEEIPIEKEITTPIVPPSQPQQNYDAEDRVMEWVRECENTEVNLIDDVIKIAGYFLQMH